MNTKITLDKTFLSEVLKWRRYLHAHPETAFEETNTSDFVADKLDSFGLKVSRGLAKTGVVGTLSTGENIKEKSIAFRADMDALNMEEQGEVEYKSLNKGKMHACGHDGHMAMLLGAAKYLSQSESFSGTIHFIFQPAEENLGGGGVMVEEGLFDKFPAKAVFGMHNFPTIPEGMFAICPGPMMAAYDVFDIDVIGQGGHAAMPQFAKDPIISAALIINQLQSIISRNTPPLETAVLSVTEIHGGTAYNIIPDKVTIRGTTRHFSQSIQNMIETRIKAVAEGVAAAGGVKADIRYEKRYPALINTEKETEMAISAAAQVVGEKKVIKDLPPIMGSEDFAFMLQKCPGAYMGIGSGTADRPANLHQTNFDFNDQILETGISYWVSLAQSILPK